MKNPKFSNFINSFGATKLLLDRAKQNDFLIEALVLYASLVDGLCRIGLILKEQIDNNNSLINQSYIYQSDEVRGITEREIYKLSLNKHVISEDIFNKLSQLYDFRNKLIHRFFLSEIDYSKTKTYLSEYEEVYQVLYKTIFALETQQIMSGIGMTKGGHISKNTAEESRHKIIEKIGLFSRDITHNLGYTTVEELMEFSRKNRLMDKCTKCGHHKVQHIDTSKLKNKNSKTTNIKNLPSKCLNKKCDCEQFSK